MSAPRVEFTIDRTPAWVIAGTGALGAIVTVLAVVGLAVIA